MEWNFRFSDLAVVFATLIGPIAAVQIQSRLDKIRNRTQRQIAIFRTLMATRRSIISPAHVEALNVVPIEFYGNNKKYRLVVNSWKSYIDHLYSPPDIPSWSEKQVDLLNALLMEMAKALGYEFTNVEISRELYSPKGHAFIESDQEIIRRGVAKIFRGEAAFPMDVRSFPVDPGVLSSQVEMQKLIADWLSGKSSVKVAPVVTEQAKSDREE